VTLLVQSVQAVQKVQIVQERANIFH